MQRKRLTGLAAKAVEMRDKVAGSADHVAALRGQLAGGGEDYADAIDQAEKIERAFADLSDLFIDLSVLILKADKVRDGSKEEPQEEPQLKGIAGPNQSGSGA
jgi:hypothetical protein